MEKLTIAVVVAMMSEFELVSHIINNPKEGNISGNPCVMGTIEDKNIILLKCGIGKVNAGVLVSELIAEYKPDYIINSGVAGGIGKGLKVADIVVGSECLYHDVWCGEGEWGQIQGMPLRFAADEHLLKVARSIDNDKIVIGTICTGDQFISDEDQLKSIKTNFPDGEAVDMESAAMAHVCYMRGVPFISLRVVSDTPGMEDDNTSQYFDFFTDAPKLTFGVLEELIEGI